MGWEMRTFEVPTPTRRRSATQHRARRTARFAPRCEHLESLQLLSIGQAGTAAGVLASLSVPVAQVASPPAASSIGVSSASSSAPKFGTPGGLNDGQVGFLLNEFQVVDTATQSTAILATLEANPFSDEIEVNLALTNLSVTVLNPVDTSVAAAITDTQVDADAFLVPSTTELLQGFLGVRTAPASQVGFMFSDLLGAGTTPNVTTTNAQSTVISNTSAPGSSVTNPGPNHVSSLGQSIPWEFSIYPQSSSSDDVPIEPAAPAEARQAQPAPPGGQAPAPKSEPQPAPPGGQAPAPKSEPQPAPPREGDPAREPAKARPLSPVSNSDIDAALDLTDLRDFTRSRDGDAPHPDDALSRIDTSRSLSVFFGVAMVASGGYHSAMRTGDRFRSRGHLLLRRSGAERPTLPKTATPSR
jgi:hypothetical protein